MYEKVVEAFPSDRTDQPSSNIHLVIKRAATLAAISN
jgi:hypothetical protein